MSPHGRYDDTYDRDMRDPRPSREPRGAVDFRDSRIDPRDRPDSRDPRTDLRSPRNDPRDIRPDPRGHREMREPQPRGYDRDMEDPRALDPRLLRDSPPRNGYDERRPERLVDPVREQRGSGYSNYFLPSDGINREVISTDICRYLGQDALVKPYTHTDGRRGYLITAYRMLTSAMIESLKIDSKKFEKEKAHKARNGYEDGMYSASNTFDERNREGPSMPRYDGTQMNPDNDEFRGVRSNIPYTREAREPPTFYDQPPRTSAYPGVPIYTTSAYQVQPAQAFYDPADLRREPRSISGMDLDLPPGGRLTQPMYAGDYPVRTSGPVPGTSVAYLDPITGRPTMRQDYGDHPYR